MSQYWLLHSNFLMYINFVIGNIRIQLLNLLLKDERCQKFIELSFLEKFCTFGIIIVSEIDHIETLLLPHQKIKTDYASFLQYYLYINTLCNCTYLNVL